MADILHGRTGTTPRVRAEQARAPCDWHWRRPERATTCTWTPIADPLPVLTQTFRLLQLRRLPRRLYRLEDTAWHEAATANTSPDQW